MARLKGAAPAIRLIRGALPAYWRLLGAAFLSARGPRSPAANSHELCPHHPKENTLSTHHSPYGWGAQDLNADRLSRKAPPPRKVPLQRGLLIESVDGWVGEVVLLV